MISHDMVKHLKKRVFKYSNILLISSIILLTLATIYNRIFPDLAKYLLWFVIITSALLAFTRINQKLKVILAVLLVIFSWITFYTQYAVERLLGNNDTVQTSTISLYVLGTSAITELTEEMSISTGISNQMDPELSNYFQDEVTKIAERVSFEVVPDDITGYGMLLNNELDALAIDDSIVDIILEVYPDFSTKTKVIYSAEKEFEKEDPIIPVEVPTVDTFVIYLSGIDTKGPISNRSRSDANILLSVNLKTSKITMVSIPRDTYVDLACKGDAKDKLTHAGLYGIGCSIDTIEQLIGININYYARVNFTSFVKIIDVIGSIKVYSEYEFTIYVDDINTLTFEKGMNTLNADQALRFARERHALPNGDVQRGLNQQQVIIGIINRLIEPSNITKIDKIISSVAKSVETNVNSDLIKRVVDHQLSKDVPWTFENYYLNGTGDYQTTYSMGNRPLYVYWPNRSSIAEIKAALTSSSD